MAGYSLWGLKVSDMTEVTQNAMNIELHVSFRIMALSGNMCCSGIVGSYGRFIPSFLRNHHTILHQFTFSPTG